MRKLIHVFIVVFLVTLCSCTKKIVIVNKTAPPQKAAPGQVKKTTGSQSAAPYAPGQQKKKN